MELQSAYVSWRCSAVTRFMATTCHTLPRSQLNAIHFPSGETAGYRAEQDTEVNSVTVPDSASTAKRRYLSFCHALKRTCPSGENAASRTSNCGPASWCSESDCVSPSARESGR